MECLDLLHGLQRVHFQNKQVADIVRPLCVHPACNGGTAGEGDGGDKKIFVIAQRIVRNVTGQIGGKHPHPFLHRSWIAHSQEVILVHILCIGMMPVCGLSMEVFHIPQLFLVHCSCHIYASLSLTILS